MVMGFKADTGLWFDDNNNVQETSLDAFTELKKGKLSARRQEVLNGFEQLKTATNLEVSDLIKIPINSVTPRTNELVKLGVLVKMGLRKCSISGNTAIVWGKK